MPRDQDLIGAVGEYLIYKQLCARLGPAAASIAWKSGNRRHFLPVESGDDTLGYDFEFLENEILWQLEIKSSRNKPAFFDISDNELMTARSAGRRNSRKKYAIIFVPYALSKPEYIHLGNPTSPGNSDKFRMADRGARIHFRLT